MEEDVDFRKSNSLSWKTTGGETSMVETARKNTRSTSSTISPSATHTVEGHSHKKHTADTDCSNKESCDVKPKLPLAKSDSMEYIWESKTSEPSCSNNDLMSYCFDWLLHTTEAFEKRLHRHTTTKTDHKSAPARHKMAAPRVSQIRREHLLDTSLLLPPRLSRLLLRRLE